MTLFYLHLLNRVGNIRDEEGRDLDDLATARDEAVRSARSIMAEELRTHGQIDLKARIEIASPTPNDVCDTLAFADALVIRAAEGP